MTKEEILEGKVLLVNKPYTWTSFQVVKKIKNAIHKEYGIPKIKIGHAGTLDPLATGLLIICTGKFTKKIDEYQAQEKEYTGNFTLGATTPSFDLELPIDNEYPISHITEETIRETASNFLGEQDQIPPVFSAVKIDGKRAFDYARNNEEVEIKSKKITIKAFDVESIEMPKVNFRIVCSKGTYIRSIARDFGKTLNSGAHLSELCRTRIGEYHLKDAMELTEILNSFNSLQSHNQ